MVRVRWHLGVFVVISYQPCHKDFVKEDLYVVGFTCKLFSQDVAENETRE